MGNYCSWRTVYECAEETKVRNRETVDDIVIDEDIRYSASKAHNSQPTHTSQTSSEDEGESNEEISIKPPNEELTVELDPRGGEKSQASFSVQQYKGQTKDHSNSRAGEEHLERGNEGTQPKQNIISRIWNRSKKRDDSPEEQIIEALDGSDSGEEPPSKKDYENAIDARELEENSASMKAFKKKDFNDQSQEIKLDGQSNFDENSRSIVHMDLTKDEPSLTPSSSNDSSQNDEFISIDGDSQEASKQFPFSQNASQARTILIQAPGQSSSSHHPSESDHSRSIINPHAEIPGKALQPSDPTKSYTPLHQSQEIVEIDEEDKISDDDDTHAKVTFSQAYHGTLNRLGTSFAPMTAFRPKPTLPHSTPPPHTEHGKVSESKGKTATVKGEEQKVTEDKSGDGQDTHTHQYQHDYGHARGSRFGPGHQTETSKGLQRANTLFKPGVLENKLGINEHNREERRSYILKIKNLKPAVTSTKT